MMKLYTMAVALAAVLLASACSSQAPPETVPAGAGMDAAATAVDLSARSTGELQDAADRALREGRLYSPAGDSAIEYWLEARKRDPDSDAIASALAGLQPYLLIGCEEAIARDDFVEARRLHGLIATADAAAPALPRLAEAIAQAEAAVAAREQATRLAAAEAQRLSAEAQRQRAAVQALEAGPPPPPRSSVAETTPPADMPAAPRPEAPRVADVAPAVPATPQASPPRPPAVPESAMPRLLHQPPPRYPPLALSRKLEGSVQVAFTIRADGTVEDARVVSATPAGVFERSALAAVAGYRFEPAGRSVASSVTLRFDLAQ